MRWRCDCRALVTTCGIQGMQRGATDPYSTSKQIKEMTYLEISIVSKLAEDIGSEINPNNTVNIQSANGSIKAAASQSCRLTIRAVE